jgi:hypothetical protein
MDAASCMESEDNGPSSPRRSPRILIDTSESSEGQNTGASSSVLESDSVLQQVGARISAIIDPQERLQAISTLPWDEGKRLYAEFALQENIPLVLRRKAFSSILFTSSLDEVTREGLRVLRTTSLNDEELPLTERIAFLPDLEEEAPPIAMLLSFTRTLESADNEPYNEWDIYKLTSFLMSYDRTESQEGIETCFSKQPKFFLDSGAWEEWLRTTLERSHESKRVSMLQKIREVMHSTEDVKKVAAAVKFILQYNQDTGDKETALGAFFSVITQQNVSLSEMPREQFLRQKLDINDACKALLPHVPEDKATLLTTLSDDMLQQVREGISAIIDPQERLQEISRLPWEEGNRPYAEFALQEGIPMALRRKAFSSIYLTYSLDEATREGLRNLIVTLLNDEELTDPQETLKMISMLPWEEGYQLYAKVALQENIPMALRREAFSFIYSTDSLDETTRERLKNLRTAFLSDEEPIDQREGLQAISVPD